MLARRLTTLHPPGIVRATKCPGRPAIVPWAGNGRAAWLSLLLLTLGGQLFAQSSVLAPNRRARSRPTVALSAREKLDTWTLQTIGEVSLTSPVVRLHNLVVPIGIPDAAWEDLGRVAVTLVPTDGRRLTIERQRLRESVARHLNGSHQLHWTGPDAIYVRYRGETRAVNRIVASSSPAAQKAVARKLATSLPPERQSAPRAQQAPLSTASPRVPRGGVEADRSAFPAQPTAFSADHDWETPLPEREIDRLGRLIDAAIANQWPDLGEAFDFKVDAQHPGLRELRSLRRVAALRLNEPIRSGSQLVQISGRTLEHTVTAQVKLHATPRPEAFYVRSPVRRGQRIGRDNFERRALQRHEAPEGLIQSLDELVGMEASTSLRPHQPIRRSDIQPPTVVHRGDLVEVRVAGGGITVRSNAKALGDGSAGDLIEIETERPREKLMASVVASGQVEIVTRAPRLSR